MEAVIGAAWLDSGRDWQKGLQCSKDLERLEVEALQKAIADIIYLQ